MAESSKIKPPTKADQRLSLKHHKDSVAFNLKHAREHMQEIKKHPGGPKSAKFNRAHAKEHMKHAKEHRREQVALEKKMARGEIQF